MSTTLAEMVVGNPSSNVGTSGTIRYYSSVDFTGLDGVKYKAGTLDSRNFFLTNTWSVSGGDLIVPALADFPTTSDAQPGTAKITAGIYDTQGRRIGGGNGNGILFENYQIPANPSGPLTMLYLETLKHLPSPVRSIETLSKADFAIMLEQAVNVALGTLNDASTLVKGRTKLSVAPTLSTNPIAVGDNDPRLSHPSVTFYSDDYASFNALVTAASVFDAATIIIEATSEVTSHVSVPAKITTVFTAAGQLTSATGRTVTFLGPLQAPPVFIFDTSVLFNSYAVQVIYPEWYGASPSASAATNTPALQAMIYGAQGVLRTNGSGDWIYNRTVHFSGLYSIDDELKGYHWIGFNWEGQTKFNSGIKQTAANKRIIDGQSIAYGVFSNLNFSSTAAQDDTHPLLDLDYDGSQGSDLRPQNITFTDCVIQGNSVASIGVQIAKSGGGAQGDNIRLVDCYANGFTVAAARVGAPGAYATNAVVAWVRGDIQGCPFHGLDAYGGSWDVEGRTTFENSVGGAAEQTGFDIYCEASQIPATAVNVRSESTRFSSGVGVIDNVEVEPQVTSWYDANSGGSIPGTAVLLNRAVSGTSVGGDGKIYKVTTPGTLGGLGLTAVASAGASTLVVAGTPWTVNQFAGQKVSIISGIGAPASLSAGLGYDDGETAQSIVIASNTNNTLTLASPWITVPDATSMFVIEPNWNAGTVNSGTAVLEFMDYFVAQSAQKITNSKLMGGKISVGVSVNGLVPEINGVVISRSDALNTLYDAPLSLTKINSILLASGPQNGLAPRLLRKFFIPSTNGDLGGKLLKDYTQFNLGAQKAVWSGAKASDPSSRFSDVWIGRGGGVRGDDADQVSLNIIATGGIFGVETPTGTNQAGLPRRIQGGLATGSGAPGPIEWWGGPTPGASGTAARPGTKQMSLDYLGLHLPVLTFANVGTPANGTLVFVSDGTSGNPLTGGGTGCLAIRANGVWVGLN